VTAGEPNDVSESDPNGAGPEGLAGSMGVSSERVGRMRGAIEPGTHGTESTQSRPVTDPPPEQSADPASGPEPHPANDLPPHQAGKKPNPGHAGR
jgi:hypothetical protein